MSDAIARRYLSISEFAARSGLSDSTIRRRIRDRKLPAIQPGGESTKLLIPIDALERQLTLTTTDVTQLSSAPPASPQPAATTNGPEPDAEDCHVPRKTDRPGPKPGWMIRACQP